MSELPGIVDALCLPYTSPKKMKNRKVSVWVYFQIIEYNLNLGDKI